MDMKAMVERAMLIIEEEQKRPTVEYQYVSAAWPAEMWYQQSQLQSQGYVPSVAGTMALHQGRDQKRPRPVRENPSEYVFESTNYGLLMTIFGQIPAGNPRLMFVRALLSVTVERAVPQLQKFQASYPAWSGYASALPLVAEFCIRNGHLDLLIEGLNKTKLPTPSIAGMFRELEEMIAVNFDVFSDAELEALPNLLSQIREVGDRQTWSSRGPVRGGPMVNNPHYRQGFSSVGREIVESIDGFLQQCAQARYFYLKGALQQTRNTEIESDKKSVEDYLKTLGFDDLMVKSLGAAEQDMRSTATPFELKNALGHLRSFLEQLHLQACLLIVQPGEVAPTTWGAATTLLRQKNLITVKEEQFITTLYTVVSDEAIHPLIAEREYARLFRNIVIEYGLLFLTTLQKKNVKVTTDP
jgi:hypothetical protein